jgi:hypothetical protein
VYLDDPYLARIWAKQVAPPRTVMSLKRCLSAVERIGGYKGTSLFLSADSETSMDDTSRISLISSSSPGSTPDDPMVLFAKAIDRESERLGKARPEAALLPPREGTTPFKPQFCGFFTVFVSPIQTKIYTTKFILKMEPSYRNSLPILSLFHLQMWTGFPNSSPVSCEAVQNIVHHGKLSLRRSNWLC